MSKVRGKDTKPEMAVRRFLHGNGLRYRLHARGLPGKPDLVFPRYRAVVFVHGCYWHRHEGCGFAYQPKSNVEFWQKKFDDNVKRDRRAQRALRGDGWRVFVVWECEISVARLEELSQAIRRLDRHGGVQMTEGAR
jgi:DNA mismatch endonuclease (patch repair protein)